MGPPGFFFHNPGQVHHGTPYITIQLDGSWDVKFEAGGFAWVVHAHDHYIYRQCHFLFASSAIYTEATACLHAIQWARATRHHNILLTTDSILLVQYLLSIEPADITIQHNLASSKGCASPLMSSTESQWRSYVVTSPCFFYTSLTFLK